MAAISGGVAAHLPCTVNPTLAVPGTDILMDAGPVKAGAPVSCSALQAGSKATSSPRDSP